MNCGYNSLLFSPRSKAGRLWIVFFFGLCFGGTNLADSAKGDIRFKKNSVSDAATQIELGKRLFTDKRLSANGTISCATCHKPDNFFVDGKPVAEGISGQKGTRNTPTLLNLAVEKSFFWDGRRATLEAQAGDPFINPREHGFKTHSELIAVIQQDAEYRERFRKAFKIPARQISLEHIVSAIATFERSLASKNSAFDRFYYGGEKTALTAEAARGLRLFEGRGRCTACHLIGEKSAPFSDGDFHSLGIGYKKIEPRLAEITTHYAQLKNSPIDHSVLSESDISELGRFAVTLNPADIGKFRTPSLRNVEKTAPYMHDGSVPTLEEAIELELYYRGVDSGRPLIFTPEEKQDLLAFLKSLTTAR